MKNELVESVFFSGHYRITSEKKTADECPTRRAASACAGEKDCVVVMFAFGVCSRVWVLLSCSLLSWQLTRASRQHPKSSKHWILKTSHWRDDCRVLPPIWKCDKSAIGAVAAVPQGISFILHPPSSSFIDSSINSSVKVILYFTLVFFICTSQFFFINSENINKYKFHLSWH